MLPLPAAGAGATGDTAMSSTQLIEQCATRLRGIVEALDNIHDTSPHRWSTDLDDVHSSAESLLAMINDQAPARSEASFEEWLANELEGEDGQPVPAAVCDITLARRAFNHWPKLEQPAKVGGVRFSAGVSSRLVVEAAQRLYEFESTPEKEAERPEVVAWRYGFSGGIVSDKACLDEWKSGGEYQSLMTVAQHERIAGALRFERQQMDRAFTACINERDAALARVAELEKQEPVATVAKVPGEDWNSLDFHRDLQHMQPGTKLYAAPVAQAQHSVPAYVSYTTRPAESLAGIALRQLKDESRWVEIRDINAHAFPDMQSHNYYPVGTMIKLPSPSNPVPQAWLDVQAERRRQIEAEGWTPEHDDAHSHGEMARAAACYALAGSSAPNDETAALLVSLAWPWDQQWWKPTTTRRDLVKACALGLAEIERLDRAAATQGGPRDA